MNLAAVLATAAEIASGMAHLHRHGVVHGDLSAYNVLLTRWEGGRGVGVFARMHSEPASKDASKRQGEQLRELSPAGEQRTETDSSNSKPVLCSWNSCMMLLEVSGTHGVCVIRWE